ncbi:hypothetical protein EIZ39_22625 [Ammoniphilus sp. CFH 90114]|nr:hypothetical protein EIZ39_22625 [Ammoniphilus sp. CFH 90114]
MLSIWSEDMMVFVSREHELAVRENISLLELREENFLYSKLTLSLELSALGSSLPISVSWVLSVA